MEKTTKLTRYNTNLAAEFWVLSALYRIGADAHLTLGNKKGVDIVITMDAGVAFTVEVKGLAKRYEYPANNVVEFTRENHVYVLVNFEGRIADPSFTPTAWVIPAPRMVHFITHYTNRTNISLKKLNNEGKEYLNAWHWLES